MVVLKIAGAGALLGCFSGGNPRFFENHKNDPEAQSSASLKLKDPTLASRRDFPQEIFAKWRQINGAAVIQSLLKGRPPRL